MTEWLDNDIKTAIINILNIFKKGEENMNMMKIEIEHIKKTKIKLLQMKNTLGSINSTIDIAEEKQDRKRRKGEEQMGQIESN